MPFASRCSPIPGIHQLIHFGLHNYATNFHSPRQQFPYKGCDHDLSVVTHFRKRLPGTDNRLPVPNFYIFTNTHAMWNKITHFER